MIIRLVEKESSATFIPCFDGGYDHRTQVFEQYKKNRKDSPVEIKPQFELVREFCSLMGLQCVKKQGYEADDLIASLTVKFQNEPEVDKIYIVSPDKDLNQSLKSNKAVIYDPIKKEEKTSQDISDRYGVIPERFQIYQAMIGDKIDNIPGVRKIGPKTAVKLINADEVPTDNEEYKLSLILTTLIDNLDIDVTISQVKVDFDATLDFFEKYELKVLQKRFKNVFEI
jgi:DNA polymerase-1